MDHQFFVGTSGWTYPHWRGVFYPDTLSTAKWFDHYAAQFHAVEVNATFYRAFGEDTYRRWAERAPTGFRYVLKAPRLISHRKCLLDVASDLKAFLQSAERLGDKLGLVLLQLPPSLPFDLDRLEAALVGSGRPEVFAVEFRHPAWWSERTYNLLRRLGVTFVCPDAPKCPLVGMLTSDQGYLRLHGRKSWYRYDYSPTELDDIAHIARQLAASGARRVYVFFNNDIGGYAPANARALNERLLQST